MKAAYKQMLARVGVFFLVVGAFLFVLFVSSDLAKNVDFDYLFLSLLAVGIGWLIYNHNRERPAGAGRFGIFRRRREGHKGNEKESK